MEVSYLAKLRYLDIDDLYLMSELLKNNPPSVISKKMLITPPAISHRMKKLDTLFGPGLYQKIKGSVSLSNKGRQLALKNRAALEVCFSMIHSS